MFLNLRLQNHQFIYCFYFKVLPKSGVTKTQIDSSVNTFKLWINTWWFYIENHSEYVVSKDRLFLWLEQKVNEGIFPSLTVSAMQVWIQNCLEDKENLWLNCVRLYVSGMDQRTTSPAEGLHWSIKSGFDKVLASMNIETSAEV